jgi:ribosomal protein S18 acetylase RimI-like enzyme
MEMALETEGKKLDDGILEAGVRGIFEDAARGFYLVAEIEGKVAGSLMVTKEWSDWRNGDFWWIQSVYVLPEYRRQGVFRELYEEARRRAKEDESVCGCRLYVETENQSAQQVYLKHGFVETGYLLFEDVF